MHRREFLRLAAAAAAAPRAALGQQPVKVPHVAWLTRPVGPTYLQAFQDGLAANGYADGHNVIVDVYTAPNDADLPAYVAKIIEDSPAVIATISTVPALALKSATATIPVVFLHLADPVGAGLVPNLSHPGGNMTGTTILGPDLIAKQIAMLAEIVPALRRFAVPTFPADPISQLYLAPIQSAARSIGIDAVFVELVQGQDLASQFDRVFDSGSQAGFQPPFGQLTPYYDLMFGLYLGRKLPVLSGQAVQRW